MYAKWSSEWEEAGGLPLVAVLSQRQQRARKCSNRGFLTLLLPRVIFVHVYKVDIVVLRLFFFKVVDLIAECVCV